MERFEALLSRAGFGVVTTCDPGDADGDGDDPPAGDTYSVSDHARDRHATYVEPCLAPDPDTARVVACLDALVYATDERYDDLCRLPSGP